MVNIFKKIYAKWFESNQSSSKKQEDIICDKLIEVLEYSLDKYLFEDAWIDIDMGEDKDFDKDFIMLYINDYKKDITYHIWFRKDGMNSYGESHQTYDLNIHYWDNKTKTFDDHSIVDISINSSFYIKKILFLLYGFYEPLENKKAKEKEIGLNRFLND